VVTKLHQILSPFLLRRLKADVEIDLPKKKEIILYCNLTNMQQGYYNSIKNRTLREKVLASGSETAKLKVNSGQMRLLNIAMQLRKCCNHPYLFDYPEDEDEDSEFGFVCDENLIKHCGKLQIMDRLLRKLKEKGHKVLIFSQMTKMLNILEAYIKLRGFRFCRIDGSTPQPDRQKEMDEFNGDQNIFCFLLSTRAGGLGINLTAADTVIIYDSDWNPQMDLQAQDRCHRIGQTRPVAVYRLITQNSIESRILDCANGKRRLEKLVIHKGKFKSSTDTSKQKISITAAELNELLNSDKNEAVGSGGIINDNDLERILDRNFEIDTPTDEVKRKGFAFINSEAVATESTNPLENAMKSTTNGTVTTTTTSEKENNELDEELAEIILDTLDPDT